MNIMRFLLAMFLAMVTCSAEIKIAVVDEQKVMDQYEKSDQLVKQLEAGFRQKEKELKDLESSITQAEKEMRTASASKRQQLFETITKNRIELDVTKKFMSEYFSSQRNRFTVQVVQDIEKAIEVVAKESGYDLVLRKTVPGPRESHKTVFYHSDKLDITAQVLSYLNAKFRQMTP
jgi:Skp family chaperone for outer membrane proteins